MRGVAYVYVTTFLSPPPPFFFFSFFPSFLSFPFIKGTVIWFNAKSWSSLANKTTLIEWGLLFSTAIRRTTKHAGRS